MKNDDPAANPFPPSHPYRGGATGRGAAVFWVSADVHAWQLAELGGAPPPYPDWPSNRLSPQRPVMQQAPEPLGLLG